MSSTDNSYFLKMKYFLLINQKNVAFQFKCIPLLFLQCRREHRENTLLAEAIAVDLDSIYTFVPNSGGVSHSLDQKHWFPLTFWVF